MMSEHNVCFYNNNFPLSKKISELQIFKTKKNDQEIVKAIIV